MAILESFKVGSTTIASNVIVAVSSNTIYLPTTSATPVIGVTKDVGNVNQAAPVVTHGLAQIYFNDSCTSGALVAADSSGYGVAAALATAASYYIGTLMDAKVNDTGTVAWVYVNPGVASTEA